MDKVIRQGDVVIKLNQKVPKGAQNRKDKTLAFGEATGHHHSLSKGVVLGDREALQWIVLDTEAELTHQEHDTLVIPPGTHEVNIQREYSPERIRRVID